MSSDVELLVCGCCQASNLPAGTLYACQVPSHGFYNGWRLTEGVKLHVSRSHIDSEGFCRLAQRACTII